MSLKGRLAKLERKDPGLVVVIADRVTVDGEPVTDRDDLDRRRVILLEPDAVDL